MSPDIARARELVSAAKRIVVLTGAGISAESGVPTFRGPNGLWKSYRPEQLATPEAFARDPCLVWEWYAWRRSLVGKCRPNPGHLALARLALGVPGRTTIVTQNVDGLHHRAARAVAAAPSSEAGPGAQRSDDGGPDLVRDPEPAFPLEVHGAIHRDRCSGCGRSSDGVTDVDATSVGTLPRCLECGALLRPDVVWFGESLDPEVIGASFDAAREADVCLVVGTSALVHPAAAVPDVTLRSGGIVIEVNLEPTPLSRDATVSLRGEAGKLVPEVVD
jgi:NAD-dependent protein deacetylase/lipoamidase